MFEPSLLSFLFNLKGGVFSKSLSDEDSQLTCLVILVTCRFFSLESRYSFNSSTETNLIEYECSGDISSVGMNIETHSLSVKRIKLFSSTDLTIALTICSVMLDVDITLYFKVLSEIIEQYRFRRAVMQPV